MRLLLVPGSLVVLSSVILGQAPAPAFEVASVKLNQNRLGPGYNNRVAYSPTGVVAKNATLRRLISEAYRVQRNQVLGPGWLDENEYDVEARTAAPAGPEQVALMLRTLLSERFHLKQHGETRESSAHGADARL